METKLVPPLVDSCHFTVGVGEPVADAVNVTLVPALTVTLDGLVLTVGALRPRNAWVPRSRSAR
jgi:hypothetical protein